MQLTLLLDQGEEAQGVRWQSHSEKFQELREVLAYVRTPAIVVLGPPGSGKSTLLRHYELECAQAALQDADLRHTALAWFVSLNAYGLDQRTPPVPLDWLAAQWQQSFPHLPGLTTVLRQRQVTLLLDAFNEIPVAGDAPIQRWRAFVRQMERDFPETRVIFSCRSLDYSASLSSKDLPVPQVRIESLSDAQVEEFMHLYCPEHGTALWQNLRGTPQLEVLRSPYYLTLLVTQAISGAIPQGPAALFSGFMRHAVEREIAGDNRPLRQLLPPDVEQWFTQRAWASPFVLPAGGPLFPKLSALAFYMQLRRRSTEAGQVRLAYADAVAMLADPQAAAILKAGVDLGVLEHDVRRQQILYVHQLLQEYFAARHLVQQPYRPSALARFVPRGMACRLGLLSVAGLVHQEWHAHAVRPDLQTTLRTLADTDPLPPLPSTGWEETALLAVAMASASADFLRVLMEYNLPLAGRCAAQPEVEIAAAVQDRIRQALAQRTQDPTADLRARIAAGLALGEVGDPRFVRQKGPWGAYVLPPLIEIVGGTYAIGSDDGTYADEAPLHAVQLQPFAIGQFPVTNAEWRLFLEAGGYEDERWWDTEEARAWRRGEETAEGAKQQWREDRQYFQNNFAVIRQLHQQGRITSQQVDDWEAIARMSDKEFEALLKGWYPPGRQTQPAYWHDGDYNHPSQPVVGICWFEARAYCAWLSAQTGQTFRLPTEAEWEAAARGKQGRRYAFGSTFDASRCNTFETHIRRTTPIGVFPGGTTSEGVVDMTGNVWEWTSSQYTPYPYDAADGREEPVIPAVRRAVRGGAWFDDLDNARATSRLDSTPDIRVSYLGLRVVRASPSLP